jgi:hypothetical protein
MFTIELTRGLGWNAPAMAVILTMERYLGDAETFARQLLQRIPGRESGKQRQRLSHLGHARPAHEGECKHHHGSVPERPD